MTLVCEVCGKLMVVTREEDDAALARAQEKYQGLDLAPVCDDCASKYDAIIEFDKPPEREN